MIYNTIISPEDLAENLQNPGWVVVDCRFDLARPEWGKIEYLNGHIPGAVYADLDHDLSGNKAKEVGRHPLPDLNTFIKTLGSWGITSESQVVVYDTVSGAFASRLWWMLRHIFQHPAAAVLDGGLPAWVDSGYSLTSGYPPTSPQVTYTRKPFLTDMVTTPQLLESLKDPSQIIIDARSSERFRGEIEPIDPIKGHIPGAVNRFHGLNLSQDGKLLPVEQLREQFLQLLDNHAPHNAVVYCGSGVTSCFHILAMEAAGLPGAKVYIGSWSEWIRDPDRPIATG